MDIIAQKCSVCLQENTNSVNIRETDENNVKWSYKLSLCVPEVEWTGEHLICQPCIQQLEIACAFRNLCLQSSTLVRKRQWKINTKDDTTTFNHADKIETNTESTDDTKCKKENQSQELPYDCSYSDESFQTSSTLSKHQKIHLHQRHYECNICNTSYNTISVLRKHKILKHTSEDQWNYLCPYCNKKYPFKYKRDAHILQNHKITQKYICYHCDKVFKSKLMLIAHIRAKHSNKKFTKQCHICRNVYINQVILEDHMRKEHGIGTRRLTRRIKKYECNKCMKMYTTDKAMKVHYETCDGIKRHKIKTEQIETEFNIKSEDATDLLDVEIKTDENDKDEKMPLKSNVCQICGMVFNTRYLAKRHIRNVHATEKNYQCDVCQQKFASPVYLNAHKRYHLGERSHICSFCGKGFITGSDLYHHEKIHANKRAYKCDKCPKAFNTSSDLHKHKLCVHQDRSQWKYVCTFCDRRFPLKTNLDAHTKTHTGERNFKCHLCERRCVNKSVLLRHIKSHSNVRLFKCSFCTTEYKYQKSLDIHMTKVHGIGDAKIPERTKKYFCHICPKSYFANNKLQKHIRTHTGERPFSCHICEKRFIDKSYVKQHLKSAHSVIFSETDVK